MGTAVFLKVIITMVKLGDAFPNFTKDSTEGPITFNEWAGDSWVCFCSHPADFTPVCTTELGLLTKIMPEFTKRNTKVIALSCNPVDSHVQWQADIMKHSGSAGAFPYPIVDDTSRELAVELGMVDPEEVSATGAPMTCRAVFIISPDKKVKLSILYPASCGRNFDEVLRALDSLQMTVKHKVATPVNWVKGGECMVVPSVKDADMAALFPLGVRIEAVPSGKGYLRFTPDPSA